MRTFTLLLGLLLLFPLQGAIPVNGLMQEQKIVDNSGGINDNNQDSTIENDIFNSDPDILAIRPQQRALPPLSSKNKIVWSFKLAKQNIFL